MKKLILLSALLFSFNGWAELYSGLMTKSDYDGAVVCFNSNTKIYDIKDIDIYKTQLNSRQDRYIKYKTKDFREHQIIWNLVTSTSCNITYDTERSVCVIDGEETDMKNCKK